MTTGLSLGLGLGLSLGAGGGVAALLASHFIGMRSATDTAPGPELTADISWLGAPVDFMHLFYETGASSSTWAQNLGYVQTITAAYAGLNCRYDHGFPGCSTTEPMSETTAGLHDAVIIQMLQTIAAFDLSPRIFLRLMWEPTYSTQHYSTYAWSASSGPTGPADYIACFRHIVGLARSVSSRFAITWCGSPGALDYQGNTFVPSTCYPGDDVVDIIGMDDYWVGSDFSSSINGARAFYIRLTNPYNLDWYYNFALAHNKPFAIPEFGVGADQPDCLISFAEYLRDKPVIYAGYFNKGNIGDAGVFNCRITNNQYPNLGAAFIKQFGAVSIVTPAAFSFPVGSTLDLKLEASKRILNWKIVGGADASLFTIANGILSCTGGGQSRSYVVTVRATDERGLYAESTLTMTCAGGSLLPETQFVVARCTVAPSTQNQQAIDALIAASKACGAWAAGDAFYATMGDTEQQTTLNLLSSSYTATKQGTTTFSAGAGVKGDGSTGYYDTGLTPNMPGHNMTMDNDTIIVLALDNVTGVLVGGGSNLFIQRDSAGTVGGKPGSFTGQAIGPVATLPGVAGFSRTGPASGTAYANGSPYSTFTTASTHFQYDHVSYCGNPADSTFGTGTVGAVFIGGSLTDAQHAAMATAFSAFAASFVNYVVDGAGNRVTDGSSYVYN